MVLRKAKIEDSSASNHLTELYVYEIHNKLTAFTAEATRNRSGTWHNFIKILLNLTV